jgi:hypothetical protein
MVEHQHTASCHIQLLDKSGFLPKIWKQEKFPRLSWQMSTILELSALYYHT